MTDRPKNVTKARVVAFDDGSASIRNDRVVTEEPMEIRLSSGGQNQTVAVTMRTPGNDFELAAGFLFSEGVLADPAAVSTISYCRDDDLPAEQLYNIVIVEIRTPAPDLSRLERHFQISSSCGVCGKANIEAIEMLGCKPVAEGPVLAPATILSLPDRLRFAQGLFDTTGGLHAAALFGPGGDLIEAREDVGRHNAVDKLMGRIFLDGRMPLGDHILMVSGRSSFEIVQKAVMAGMPVVCSVSAPSSLAIDVAERFGVTLVGFLRGSRFNVYTGGDRIGAG